MKIGHQEADQWQEIILTWGGRMRLFRYELWPKNQGEVFYTYFATLLPSYCIVSNKGVTDEWYIIKDLEELVCGLIRLLSWYLLGSTEENYDALRIPVVSAEVQIDYLASKRLSVTAVPNTSSRLIFKI
jgi:hypothetical protein